MKPDASMYELRMRGTHVLPLQIYPLFGGFSAHWHHEMEILYISNGIARLNVNGRAVTAGEGEALFINPPLVHGGFCVGSAIVFPLDLLPSLATDEYARRLITPLINRTVIFPERYTDTSHILCRLLSAGPADQAGYLLKVRAYLLELVADLYSRGLYNDVPAAASPGDYKICLLLEYVDRHFLQPFSLDGMAAGCGISKYHMCRLFKQHTGQTILQYLAQKRIAYADTLLRERRLSVTETAYQCGYNDTSYFIRQYKMYKGRTPYRAKAENQKG